MVTGLPASFPVRRSRSGSVWSMVSLAEDDSVNRVMRCESISAGTVTSSPSIR